MKNICTFLLLLLVSASAIAQKNKEIKSPIIGTWKFSIQSKQNEFRKTFDHQRQADYQTEFFTFETNHTFRHDFADKDGNIVKTMKGKWKTAGEKISITYIDIDYVLLTSYFFLDKDLVLGKNFSHVIFTKATDEENVAMNMK